MPDPVPPPRLWVSWKPWRQSQPSASFLTTSSTESTNSAPANKCQSCFELLEQGCDGHHVKYINISISSLKRYGGEIELGASTSACAASCVPCEDYQDQFLPLRGRFALWALCQNWTGQLENWSTSTLGLQVRVPFLFEPHMIVMEMVMSDFQGILSAFTFKALPSD